MVIEQIPSYVEQFVSMLSRRFNIKLDFTNETLFCMDGLVSDFQKMTLSKQDLVEIKNGLSYFLGECICQMFNASWVQEYFEGQDYLGVTLANKTIIAPFAWMEKRFRYGTKESITMKINVFVIPPKKRDFEDPQWNDDRKYAEQFAKTMLVPEEERLWVDGWISEVLLVHQYWNINPIEDKLNELETDAFSRKLDITTKKYWFVRMIKLLGEMLSMKLPWPLPMIRHTIGKLKEGSLRQEPYEFTAMTSYLKSSRSVHHSIFEGIWKTESSSSFFRRASQKDRLQCLSNLLDLDMKRGYYHSIADFKHILKFVRDDEFEIKNRVLFMEWPQKQGLCRLLEFILHYTVDETIIDGFCVKRDIINWLDNATGREPKKPWLDKLDHLRGMPTDRILKDVTQWIIQNEQFRNNQTGDADETYRRFYKSAEWYVQRYEK